MIKKNRRILEQWQKLFFFTIICYVSDNRRYISFQFQSNLYQGNYSLPLFFRSGICKANSFCERRDKIHATSEDGVIRHAKISWNLRLKLFHAGFYSPEAELWNLIEYARTSLTSARLSGYGQVDFYLRFYFIRPVIASYGIQVCTVSSLYHRESN